MVIIASSSLRLWYISLIFNPESVSSYHVSKRIHPYRKEWGVKNRQLVRAPSNSSSARTYESDKSSGAKMFANAMGSTGIKLLLVPDPTPVNELVGFSMIGTSAIIHLLA